MSARNALCATLIAYSCESKPIRTIAHEAALEFLILANFQELCTADSTLMSMLISTWRGLPNGEMRLLEEIRANNNIHGLWDENFCITMIEVMRNLKTNYQDGTVTDIVLVCRSFFYGEWLIKTIMPEAVISSTAETYGELANLCTNTNLEDELLCIGMTVKHFQKMLRKRAQAARHSLALAANGE